MRSGGGRGGRGHRGRLGVRVQAQEISCVADRRFLGCRGGGLWEDVSIKISITGMVEEQNRLYNTGGAHKGGSYKVLIV